MEQVFLLAPRGPQRSSFPPPLRGSMSSAVNWPGGVRRLEVLQDSMQGQAPHSFMNLIILHLLCAEYLL